MTRTNQMGKLVPRAQWDDGLHGSDVIQEVTYFTERFSPGNGALIPAEHTEADILAELPKQRAQGEMQSLAGDARAMAKGVESWGLEEPPLGGDCRALRPGTPPASAPRDDTGPGSRLLPGSIFAPLHHEWRTAEKNRCLKYCEAEDNQDNV